MIKYVYVLLILTAIAALWIFALLPRHGHKRLPRLRQYRYAHRGLHNEKRGIPENSILAFRYALAGGFGAEIDVRLTKDKQLAVIHDSDLRRLCGVKARVEDMTMDQLKLLQLQGTNESIPRLEEVLALFCGKAPLIIELKTTPHTCRTLCGRTCRLLETYQGDFCLESFDPRALWWLRRNEPFMVRGQLTQNLLHRQEGMRMGLLSRMLLTGLLTNIATRPDFVACRYEDRNRLSPRVCLRLLKAQEVSWTLRTQEDLEKVESSGGIAIFEGFLPKLLQDKPNC